MAVSQTGDSMPVAERIATASSCVSACGWVVAGVGGQQAGALADLRVGQPEREMSRRPRVNGLRRPLRQACWAMLTIQPMPNRSTHMPNSSPHTCFSSGTVTVPPSLSFSQ